MEQNKDKETSLAYGKRVIATGLWQWPSTSVRVWRKKPDAEEYVLTRRVTPQKDDIPFLREWHNDDVFDIRHLALCKARKHNLILHLSKETTFDFPVRVSWALSCTVTLATDVKPVSRRYDIVSTSHELEVWVAALEWLVHVYPDAQVHATP